MTLHQGQDTYYIPIQIVDDDLMEPEERFSLSLTGAVPSSPQRNVSILDGRQTYAIAMSDPTTVSLSAVVDRIVEGDSASFRVSLSGGELTVPLVLGVSLHPGSTVDLDDLSDLPSSLALLPGERETEFSIVALREPGFQNEGQEHLSLTLSLAEPMPGLSLVEETATVLIDEEQETWDGFELGLAAFARSVGATLVDDVGQRAPSLHGPPSPLSFFDMGNLTLTQSVDLDSRTVQPTAQVQGGTAEGGNSSDHLLWKWATPSISSSSLEQTTSSETTTLQTLLWGDGHLLPKSRFLLTPPPSSERRWLLWGEGSLSRYRLERHRTQLDGGLLSARLGFDLQLRNNLLAGLVLSHDTGSSRYQLDGREDSRMLNLETIGLYPYVHWQPLPELGVWTLAGYSAGEASLTDQAEDPLTTDIHLGVVAAGIRRELAETHNLNWAVKSDVFLSGIQSEQVEDGTLLPAVSAQAWRLRTTVEGQTQPRDASPVPLLSATFQAGLLAEGGDAVTGGGLELAAQLSHSNPEAGLQAELQGRWMASLGPSPVQDWGASLNFSYHTGALGEGLSLRASPAWGQSSHTIDAMWAPSTSVETNSSNTVHSPEPSLRLPVRVAYGIDLGDGALLTPFAESDSSSSRLQQRLGAELSLSSLHHFDLQLSLYEEYLADTDTLHRQMHSNATAMELILTYPLPKQQGTASFSTKAVNGGWSSLLIKLFLQLGNF